jgi:hypothetical protein
MWSITDTLSADTQNIQSAGNIAASLTLVGLRGEVKHSPNLGVKVVQVGADKTFES